MVNKLNCCLLKGSTKCYINRSALKPYKSTINSKKLFLIVLVKYCEIIRVTGTIKEE